MPERRRRLVAMAFNILDKDGSGEIDPDDIIGVYDASKHPDVISGKRTPDEILREFLDTFDVGGVKDGKVTKGNAQFSWPYCGFSFFNSPFLVQRNLRTIMLMSVPALTTKTISS
jgi:hypothetical protein